MALEGIKMASSKEGFVTDQEKRVCIESFLVYIAFLAIALLVANGCGGEIRQYLAAFLNPIIYLIIRLAVPCKKGM